MWPRVLLSLAFTAFCAHAGILMQVIPSLSPATASPSFAGWRSNAINALENGIVSIGDPTTNPEAYYQVSQLGDGDNIVSTFPSWHGTANPGTAFGPAFANESGNLLFFGLVILGTDSTTFSLSNLRVHLHSDDPATTFNAVFDFSSFNYSSGSVGIDPVSGNPITSGPGTQTVRALYYGGAGIVYVAPNGICTGTDQATLNCVKGIYDALMPFHLIADYTLLNDAGTPIGSAQGSVLFAAPEPATLGSLTLGALALLGLWGRAVRSGPLMNADLRR